jgi:hypothetical protein
MDQRKADVRKHNHLEKHRVGIAKRLENATQRPKKEPYRYTQKHRQENLPAYRKFNPHTP